MVLPDLNHFVVGVAFDLLFVSLFLLCYISTYSCCCCCWAASLAFKTAFLFFPNMFVCLNLPFSLLSGQYLSCKEKRTCIEDAPKRVGDGALCSK